MNGFESALAIGIAIAVVVVCVILFLCIYGGRKIGDSIDASVDKKLAAKRDAEERGILIESDTEWKEKIGIIISPLEGFLTESNTFWKNINAEIGVSAESDPLLTDPSFVLTKYPAWVRKMTSEWKELMRNSPSKLNKDFFNDFYQKYLRIREGAKEFVEYCMENYDYYVVSEAPWEFCLLAKEQLGFYHYYATTLFTFDRKDQLGNIVAHQNGFQTDKLMAQIIMRSIHSMKETVVISNSARDIGMLNEAGFGILISRGIPPISSESALNPSIISLPDVDFEDLKVKLDRITDTIKQAATAPVENEK